MNIQLKERQEEVINNLKAGATFKIPESHLVFMRIDVEGLTILTKKLPEAQEDPKPIKVQVPEGKVSVICLNTGKAQFLGLSEKVKVVNLQCIETLE